MKLIVFLLIFQSALAQEETAVSLATSALSSVEVAGQAPKGDPCAFCQEGNFGSDPRYGTSLKNHAGPSRGCIAENTISDSEANRLITSQEITTVGATEKERRVLAAAIKRVQQLNGGPIRGWRGVLSASPPMGLYPWRYYDNHEEGSSVTFHLTHILINRKTNNRNHNHNHHYGHSVAQQVHEWAHYLGYHIGLQDQFQNFMRGNREYGNQDYCMVSNYADNTPGEQFAEVFTAFITEPRILLNNSRTPENCRKVFNFFLTWFPQGERVQDCL